MRAGITIATTPALNIVGDQAVAWLTGGTVATACRVVNRIVTDGGRRNDWTILVFVTHQ